MRQIKYLIIGNGIAGLSAAKEIRKKDNDGSILMVSKEAYLTYYRPRLTEGLYENMKPEDILVNKSNWYEEKNIHVELNCNVEKIDVDNNKVLLSQGEHIEYEKLLIATGSHPFVPPIKGKVNQDIVALRTLDDLYYFKDCLKNWENVTVVGGGLLGLEAAWSIKKLGKKVNIVEFAPYLLSKQLDEEISRKLEKRFADEGFDIYLSSTVEEVLENGTAVLNGGRKIKTDGIIYSIGVRPNLDIIKESGLIYNRGIVVDKYLKTNIDNVYAAGDVIELDGVVMGLWSLSSEQGKIAGANMAGETVEYTWPKPFTMLKLGDIQVFSVGDIKGYDRIHEVKRDANIHHKYFTKDGKLIGGILFGDTKDMGKLKKAVFDGEEIELYLSREKV